MIKRIIIVLLGAVLILGGLFGIKFFQIWQATSSVKLPPPATVAAAAVRLESWPVDLSAIGTLTPVAGVDVNSQVAGQIKTLHFNSGQSVKRGDLLVELDSETDKAELKGLLAELDLAQAQFQRSQRMIAQKFVSQADYDQHKATLQQIQAAVEAKRSHLRKKQIRAPFAGELGIRRVSLGWYMKEGEAIVSLQQLDPINLDFSLPERHLGQLAVQQMVKVSLQAYPGETFNGQIVAIDPGIDKGSRNLNIRAKLANPNKRLRPGMFAEVHIDLGQDLPILTLPDTAISYNPYGNSVFKIQEGETGLTVQSRQVVTGKTQRGRVEIVSGLSAGDRVVSAGQVKLRNGMPVSIDKQPAPGERETAE